MKKPLLISSLGLLLSFVLFVLFFFWAKQPSLSENERFTLLQNSGFTTNSVDTFSVLTYNIGYLSGMTNNLSQGREVKLFDQNMKRSLNMLGRLNPDLIGFQEIDFNAKRSFYRDQAAELSEKLGYGSVYRSVNWDVRYLPFPYWPPKFHFGKVVSGQAIFSKYPLSNPETITLPKPESESFMYNAFYIDRLVQVVDVKMGGRTVKLLNLHLEAFDESSRVVQAEMVRELFNKWSEDYPTVLVGDFNSQPAYEPQESEAMKVIMTAKNIASCVTKNAYDKNKMSFYTFSTGQPEYMIDYILYNDNFFECTNARRIDEASDISDHFPIFAKLVFIK